jgi:dihydroorotate dehydrogenase
MQQYTSDSSPIGIAAGMIKQPSQVEEGLLSLVRAIEYGSHTLHEKERHKEPVFWFNEKTQGSVNSVGLGNKGLWAHLEEDLPELIAMHEGTDCVLDESLAPLKSGDLLQMSEMLVGNPNLKHIRRVVVNAACPNHRSEEGLQPVLARDPVAVQQLLVEFGPLHGHVQRAIKIAPKTETKTLRVIVRLCLLYEVDYIISGNTDFGSSVIDDVQRISQPTGGHAGLPLLDSAVEQAGKLRMIIDKLGASDQLRVVGCGGIMNAEGLRRYQSKGVRENQVATLYWQFGVRGIQDLLTEHYA